MSAQKKTTTPEAQEPKEETQPLATSRRKADETIELGDFVSLDGFLPAIKPSWRFRVVEECSPEIQTDTLSIQLKTALALLGKGRATKL